MKYITLPGTN